MSDTLLKSALKMSKAQRILLAERLWDSVAEEMERFPYSILFVDLPEGVAVIGVLHAARDPKLIRRQAQ